tara:strand:+ start:200 stop:496 length:297 start_codon:yes stop_codon:yes gene_type:complete
MIKLRYLLITFFLFSVLDGQEILKDGEKPTSFSYEEAVEMLKARDAEWEAKVKKLKEKVYVDSLIIVAKNAHIESQKKQIKVLELLTNVKEYKYEEEK